MNASNLANIPEVLKKMPNWVVWKLVERDGKPTKPPYVVGTNTLASSTDPTTWTTFEAAKASVDSTGIGKESGIGFAIGGVALDMNLIAIDLDGCLFPDGTVSAWVDELMSVAGGYVEITPSETGLRIIGTGKLPSDRKVFKIDPAAGFGDKVQIECYDCKKYITMTGNIYYEDPGDIESLDMSAIYAVIRGIQKKYPFAKKETKTTNIENGAAPAGGKIEQTGTAITTDYELFMSGTLTGDQPCTISDDRGNSRTFAGQSEARMSFANAAALHHADNSEAEDAIWDDFTKSCVAREDWLKRERYFRSHEIAKAIKWASEVKAREQDREQTSQVSTATFATTIPEIGTGAGITFTRPRVERDEWKSYLDYVIAASLGKWDGWFPIGDVSLIGGASGAGKSTLIYELLDKQSRGETVFGHETHGLPFLIVTYDRGENAHKRTMKRMGLEGREKDFPTEHLSPLAVDSNIIAQEMIEAIEKHETLPKILFVEGGDIASGDASKSGSAKTFLNNLMKIAKHFHMAIILSVGTPKMKVNEGYVAQRDHVFGSSFWGRMSETIAVLHFVEGDDTSPRRKLAVLPRNEVAEKFSLMFSEEGRLVTDTGDHDEAEEPEIGWFRARGATWFTVRDVMAGLGVPRTTADRMCQYGVEDGYLRKRSGPRPGRGAGQKAYQWLDTSQRSVDTAGISVDC